MNLTYMGLLFWYIFFYKKNYLKMCANDEEEKTWEKYTELL